MKINLSLLFFLVYISVNSQVLDNLNVRIEASINAFNSKNDKLLTIRPVIAYDIDKFQIVGGIVLSNIVEVNYVNGRKSQIVITGGELGLKYYIGSSKKGGVYCFLESMILNYFTHEAFDYSYAIPYKLTLVPISTANTGNRTFIFQPIIGGGGEAKFFNIITFSIDLGLGLTYRKMKFERDNINYPSKLVGFTTQLRIGLGIAF